MIPRAVVDLIIVLLHSPGNFNERWILTKVLGKLKWSLYFRRHQKMVNVTLGGHEFGLPNMVSTQFILKEIWFQQVYKPINGFKPFRTLDLGGNIGLASLYWKYQFGNEIKIVVLEPDPENVQQLKQNLPELDCRELAVGLYDGLIQIKDNQHAVSVNKRFHETGDGPEVRMVKLDTLLLEGFDMVKMDIEGAEWKILESMLSKKELLEKVAYWMIEFHETEKHEGLMSEIIRAFDQMNYKNRRMGDVMHFYRNTFS